MSRATHPESSKTFLEKVASAVLAPTALFYKEKRQESVEDDAPLIEKNADTSPIKTPGSKKSVRFKPGKSIIDEQLRSAPIDIPQPAPTLPPMNLATTPLLKCFGRDNPGLIPTGRPRVTPVLHSSPAFRHAMAEAQAYIGDADVPYFPPLGSPLSEHASPVSASNRAVQNPFDDPQNEELTNLGPIMSRTHVQRRANESADQGDFTSSAESSPDNRKKPQESPPSDSANSRMATMSSGSFSQRLKADSAPQPPIESLEDRLRQFLPGIASTTLGNSLGINDTRSPLRKNDPDVEELAGQVPCLRRSSQKSRKLDDEWTGNTTHEDIRGRFQEEKHETTYDSDPFRDEDRVCARATIIPMPGFMAKMDTSKLPESAMDESLPMESNIKRRVLLSSSDDVSISLPSSATRY